ncbi:MAG: hypothetical protein EXQ69_07960 [Acidimicrobiia bacterium]|nr:hypothetical protein [Acidimicrobiia bacterium]
MDDLGDELEVQSEVLELERELCRLPEISAARVVTNADGHPSEVHILASSSKHAKQVVRDVQSVALASFGIELDRRIVSVVQLDDNGDSDPQPQSPLAIRAVLVNVASEVSGLRSLVRVTLRRAGTETVGFAEGSIASTARHRLVATAAVDALRQLETAAECIDVDSAQVMRVGAHDVAFVVIVFVLPPSEQLSSGSAIVREHADGEAVVRAVLDATNRRLPQLA